MRRWIITLLVISFVATACSEPESEAEPVPESARLAAALAFEQALWEGDLETALAHVTDDFTYEYPFEALGVTELRDAFGHGDHGPSEVALTRADYAEHGDTVTWVSIRRFDGSIGQAVAMSATFEGDLMALVTEEGTRTTAVDAMGCDESFGYSWHADYAMDASGESTDPAEAASAAFPRAAAGVLFEPAKFLAEAPMSGGHGPIVRASHEGFTVGFVFLTEASDGTLLVDAVEACEGYLEPGFGEEGH